METKEKQKLMILLQFEMSLSQLAISLGDQVNFLSGSYSNRHEVYLNMSCCDNRSDLAPSHVDSRCRTSGKWQC